jgi:hypothetical protein
MNRKDPRRIPISMLDLADDRSVRQYSDTASSNPNGYDPFGEWLELELQVLVERHSSFVTRGSNRRFFSR